jgi:NAD(P)-dependent dehydrogenase (short-subunit alcohol dehydrogenase family)
MALGIAIVSSMSGIAAPREIPLRILLIGASGTLGQKVASTLSAASHELVRIGRKAGDVLADLADPKGLAAVYEKLKPFDAVAIAAGDVAFGPLAGITRDQWQFSFNNKLLGQIWAVHEALPYINDRGSFTLIGGLFGEEPVPMAAAASTVNRALEGFVLAAAIELPRACELTW